MKKTISCITQGKAFCFVLLTGLFLALSSTEASAQQSAQGNLNPYTHIATKMDVTAYPLGTFERTHSMQVLEQMLAGMKQIFSNGGGTLSQRLKYDYLNNILRNLNDYVAVEIALLTGLSELTAANSSTEIQNAQLRSLYNEIVNQID